MDSLGKDVMEEMTLKISKAIFIGKLAPEQMGQMIGRVFRRQVDESYSTTPF